MTTNSSRLAISLDTSTDEDLRAISARMKTRHGLVARALIKYGLAQIDDQDVQALIQEEVDAERARRAQVGKSAMESRWVGTRASSKRKKGET